MKIESVFVVDLQVGQVITLPNFGKLVITNVIVNGNDVRLFTRGFYTNCEYTFDFTYPTFTCWVRHETS